MDATIYVTYIASTPEKVWEALTSCEFTKQYFFGRCVESDWKPGSRWTLRMESGQIDVEGEVLESEPPRRLRLTWHVNLDAHKDMPKEWLEEARALPETIVTYEIDPLGNVVRLTMTEDHAGPIPEKFLQGGRTGWPVILSGLKTLVETGRPLRIPTPGMPAD
jgi:uncharacterized protein YndB with AHSA1/START domain